MTEKVLDSPQEINEYDFTLGVLRTASRIRHLDIVFRSRDPKFHSAMALAYNKLMAFSDKDETIQPTFTVIPHQIHGDSETPNMSLIVLCADGVLERLRGGQMKYSFMPNGEDDDASDVPINGSDHLYDELAGTFIEAYYYPEGM